MIAGVAHELNNPLTSVIGYAQLLRTIPPGERFNARLETIRKEADRCRRIVHNLLRFARTPVQGAPSVLVERGRGEHGAAARLLDAVVRMPHRPRPDRRAAAGRRRRARDRAGSGESRGQRATSDDRRGKDGHDHASNVVRSKASSSSKSTTKAPVFRRPPGRRSSIPSSPPNRRVKAPDWVCGWCGRRAASHGGSIRVLGSAGGGARLRLELPAGTAVPAPVEATACDAEQRRTARCLRAFSWWTPKPPSPA